MKNIKTWFWCFFLCSITFFGQEKFTFYFDQDVATPNSNSIEMFKKWKTNMQNPFQIVGFKAYCDSLHSVEYNQVLATKRNEQVILFLQSFGCLFSDSYYEIALGEEFESDPILSNNRKVEVFFEELVASPSLPESSTSEKPSISNNPFLKKAQNIPQKPPTYQHKPMQLSLFSAQLEEAKDGDRIQIFDIHFYLDSPKMILKSEPYLNRIVTYMEKNPDVSIKIEGHMCCNVMGNIKLSEERAKNIFKYLVRNGIARNRMSYEGFGASKPIYEIPEKNPEEELKNRRVEIVVSKKKG
jgi:outer membrane protein OmpA-like peptidoglycan-associated protein